MEFNPNNNIVKLCLQGMDMEAKGNHEEAGKSFLQAWNEATDDFEKLTPEELKSWREKLAKIEKSKGRIIN